MTIAPSSRAIEPTFARLVSGGSLRIVVILLVYASAFTALHHFAAQWAAGKFFSLWFPAAGLRFAFLWIAGARMTPAAAVAELFVQLISGEATLGASPTLAVIGIVSPCLVYGLVIHLVRSRGGRRSTIIGLAPLPFALAAVIGPILACVAALPWAIPLAMDHGPIDGPVLVHSLLVFTLGDMLGVLILAPPLVWLADRIVERRRWTLRPPQPALVAEVVLVSVAAWSVVWAIDEAGLGITLGPVLLATCWVGLRTGRAGAWFSILAAAIIVLPLTDQRLDEATQFRLHMLLACIAAVGYLAGSFAEAEARSQRELARRDRLLYQAERLKTLRAMSVAVIHEISQPLSTISIEANGLVTATRAARPDIADIAVTSRLIARKAMDLSHMVRRLRTFGDRAADGPSPLEIGTLIAEVASIASPEAKAGQIVLEVRDGPDAVVMGQDIELSQALLNLLRNAIAASPRPGHVVIGHATSDGRLFVTIENEHIASTAGRPGMGVGLIIARSIAAAHGGTIREQRPDPQRFRFILDLPLAGDPNDQ
ncbi:MAG: MASE1 domain-containing protein [Sphingomonas bacterium]|nr:MASE1 domain-containing protein [Sphingomonas bacterium]